MKQQMVDFHRLRVLRTLKNGSSFVFLPFHCFIKKHKKNATCFESKSNKLTTHSMIRFHHKLGPYAMPILWLILGISGTIGVNGLLESQFENEILQNVALKAEEKTRGMNEEDKIETTIQLCHYLQVRRSEILGGRTYTSFKATNFRSSLQSFYIGTGACGYYSLFAARVFQKLGYAPRVVQQRVENRWGAHITLALPLKSNGKWILVDPLYKHCFRDTQNHLSSLHDVRAKWNSYYSKHTPSDYNPKYNYQQGWRHTNWDKYGAMSRAVYKILTFTIGKDKTDALSLRVWIIDAYRVQSMFAFLVSAFCIALIAIGIKSKNLTP